VAPKLIELSEKVLYGDAWERPGLSKRDRLANGVKKEESRIAKQVFEEKKS
jgi:hypothetical protein